MRIYIIICWVEPFFLLSSSRRCEKMRRRLKWDGDDVAHCTTLHIFLAALSDCPICLCPFTQQQKKARKNASQRSAVCNIIQFASRENQFIWPLPWCARGSNLRKVELGTTLDWWTCLNIYWLELQTKLCDCSWRSKLIWRSRHIVFFCMDWEWAWHDFYLNVSHTHPTTTNICGMVFFLRMRACVRNGWSIVNRKSLDSQRGAFIDFVSNKCASGCPPSCSIENKRAIDSTMAMHSRTECSHKKKTALTHPDSHK